MHYKEIQTHDLYSFIKEYDVAKEQGFKTSDDTSFIPQVIGSLFMATLVKDEKIEDVQETKTKRNKKESPDE